MIEMLDESQPEFNEYSTNHYNMDLDMKQEFPYQKKIAGALQCKEMPWDANSRGQKYFNIGALSAIATAALFIV